MYRSTKEKLESWPLMSLDESDKIQWFKDTIGATIGKITLTGDRVEEIIVADDLYDAAAEAMLDMPLPADFPDQPGVTRDQLERDYAAYCKSILVRTATIEQLAIPETENVAPEMQFIRPITSRMKVQGFLEHWDKTIGFTETIRMAGCPFDYTVEEKKLIFGITQALNCVAATSMKHSQQQLPKDKVNMFEMK